MTRKVVVHDLMQQGYVYHRTEPVGRNFAPAFRPQLTPRQMLRLGVFGGKYMTDCRGEFRASWFAGAKLFFEFGTAEARVGHFGIPPGMKTNSPVYSEQRVSGSFSNRLNDRWA